LRGHRSRGQGLAADRFKARSVLAVWLTGIGLAWWILLGITRGDGSLTSFVLASLAAAAMLGSAGVLVWLGSTALMRAAMRDGAKRALE